MSDSPTPASRAFVFLVLFGLAAMVAGALALAESSARAQRSSMEIEAVGRLGADICEVSRRNVLTLRHLIVSITEPSLSNPATPPDRRQLAEDFRAAELARLPVPDCPPPGAKP